MRPVRAAALDGYHYQVYTQAVPPPAPPVRRFLLLAHEAARAGRVATTPKADDELDELGWARSDLALQLQELAEADFLRTERSRYDDEVLMWVFCPPHWEGGYLWLRLVEQAASTILVVSIHPAGGDPWNS